MSIFVLIILLDFEFNGKKEIDYSMIEQTFSSLSACRKFKVKYVKKFNNVKGRSNNIKGSGCLEYKGKLK